MRFFSRITFICNLCFVAAVILRIIETSKKAKGEVDAVIPLSWLTNVLVILGYGAVIVNLIFCIVWLVLLAIKKHQAIPKWIAIANVIFLIIELLYFLNFI